MDLETAAVVVVALGLLTIAFGAAWSGLTFFGRQPFRRPGPDEPDASAAAWFTERGIDVADRDPDQAEAFFREALAFDPDDPWANAAYARHLAVHRGELVAAEAHFRRALDAGPPQAWLLARYAAFLERDRNDGAAAGAAFREALALDPGDPAAVASYGWYLIRRDEDDARVASFFERAVAAMPDDPEIRAAHAAFLSERLGEHDAAEAEYRFAAASDRLDAPALGAWAAFLLAVRDDPEGAAAVLVRALALAPRNQVNLARYAVALRQTGADERIVMDVSDRSMAGPPPRVEVVAANAELQLLYGRDGALETLERAEAMPAEPHVRLELTYCRYAHDPSPGIRDDALGRLRVLLDDGVHGFPEPGHGEVARRRGHPDADLVEALAHVLPTGRPSGDLDRFEAWRRAARAGIA